MSAAPLHVNANKAAIPTTTTTKTAKVVLSLGTLVPKEHLVLATLRKLGRPASATTILEAAHPQEAEGEQKKEEDEYLMLLNKEFTSKMELLTTGTPTFVSSLSAESIEAILARFQAGGWASWFNNSKEGRVYNLTSEVDKAIQASKNGARREKAKTESELQRMIIGGMIRLHRESGETCVPLRKYVRFHHLCCVVPLTAGIMGSKLREWSEARTRFGPLKATLAGGVQFEVTATLEVHQVDDATSIYRLAMTPTTTTTPSSPSTE